MLACSSSDGAAIANCLQGGTEQAGGAAATPTPPGDQSRPPLRESAEPAILAVNAMPDDFGGAFMNRSHTALCVLYVGSEGHARAVLERHLPPHVPTVWVPVTYSLGELERIQQEILALERELGLQDVNSVSVAHERNRVVVSVSAHHAEFERVVRQRYGQAVITMLEPAERPAA